MPWSGPQHRLFCARCNNGKNQEMCKLCHEGQRKSSKTDWKAEEKKRG